MDMESTSPSNSFVKCCDCGCACSQLMNRSLSGTWLRSIKRKIDEHEDENEFSVPGFNFPQVAYVEIGNEVAALREVVSSQQETIQGLCAELEEERNASSSAANEAMSMILRLQREKAEVQMEARQFKRFAEEKIAHDQHEILALEDLLYKREQSIQSLTCEKQAYKHKMMSYGIPESEVEGEGGLGSRPVSRNNSTIAGDVVDSQLELPLHNYPPLKCNINENQVYSEVDNEAAYDVEKYAFGETPRSRGTPRSRDHLKDLEHRINQLERTPKSIHPDGEIGSAKSVSEKVIIGQSPRRPSHLRKLSTDSFSSFRKEMGSEFSADSPRFSGSIRKTMYSHTEEFSNLGKLENKSDVEDDTSDRVYTIDSVYQGVSHNGVAEPKATCLIDDDFMMTPRESQFQTDLEDPDIKKLYMRLQALEADKESMRQAIISMRTDKAQMILLKEIAQHLCKEMSPAGRTPHGKPYADRGFSFMSVFKWATSLVTWKNKAHKSRYTFGMSPHNAGLLAVLDNGPKMGQWRCLSSIQL